MNPYKNISKNRRPVSAQSARRTQGGQATNRQAQRQAAPQPNAQGRMAVRPRSRFASKQDDRVMEPSTPSGMTPRLHVGGLRVAPTGACSTSAVRPTRGTSAMP